MNYITTGPRYNYWRCANPASEYYTLVKYSCPEEEAILKMGFEEVILKKETLPEWRLVSLREATM